MKRPVTKMSAGHYLLVGDIIRRISDPALRKTVADHFATEFNRRSARFDPASWSSMTGGQPAANSAYGGNWKGRGP